MDQSNKKLWTKDFITVSIINFTITLIFFLLMVTIAAYAVKEFNASASTAGFVSSIFIIGSLFGRLGGGNFISKHGSKKTLFIGLLFFFITTALYFVAFNLPLLMIVRLFQGVALGLASTATGTIVAQILPPARRGEGIGYYSLSAILATAIGPFVGIILTQSFEDFRIIFLVDTVLAIICFFLYFLVQVAPMTIKSVAMTEKKGFHLSNFIELKAVPISFIALLIGFSYSGVMSFMTFYSEEINLEKIGSYFFIIYAIVILATRPFTGKLLDNKGANIVVYPCLVLFAIGMFAFSNASNSITFIIAAALIGIGYGNFNSVAQAVAIKVTPNERLGLATATYFILYDLGLGIGPYILGLFVPAMGYQGIFQSMVYVIIISLVLYFFLHGRKERASRKTLKA
ncbi:MAG: MFS transporter [Kurthia sp.]|nr:MFS transporter [Candidatus Kurthia equi]